MTDSYYAELRHITKMLGLSTLGAKIVAICALFLSKISFKGLATCKKMTFCNSDIRLTIMAKASGGKFISQGLGGSEEASSLAM